MENALYNAYTPVIHRYMKRYDGTTHFKASTNMAPSNKLLGWSANSFTKNWIRQYAAILHEIYHLQQENCIVFIY